MNNHQWKWQEWQGLPYLRCSLLQDFCHGFFTQHFAPQLPEELVQVLQPEAQVYRVKQVHGKRVLPTGDVVEGVEADGLWTEDALTAVWVCSADCTPALIADRTTGKVAAVHAGWRGTALKIIPETIQQLIQAGSQKEDLVIALGPAIAGEVYQVSTQVAAEVGASIVDQAGDLHPAEILTALADLPTSPILEDDHPGRVRLDVRLVNTLQMQQLGINSDQIAIAPHCTYQQPEHFFSYRRQKLKKVQWSGIVSH